MNEIGAFVLGLLFKAFLTVTVGSAFSRLADHAIEDIKDFPRVSHYLLEHGGKSHGCTECRLGRVEEVDSIH